MSDPGPAPPVPATPPAPAAPMRRDPAAVFIGWVLLVLGVLMAVLCGGCTLFVTVASLANASEAGFAVVGLLFGGVPTLMGLVLVWAGWRLVRTRPPPPVDETFK